MSKQKEKHHFLIKVGNELIPATDEDSKFIYFMKEYEMCHISTDDTRQLWRHRKFFLLLKKVIEYMPEDLSEKYNTTDKLLIELKIQLGLFEIHTTLGGIEAMIVRGSISFGKMGEKKFTEFVNDCRNIILKRFLINMDEKTFDTQFMTLIFD